MLASYASQSAEISALRVNLMICLMEFLAELLLKHNTLLKYFYGRKKTPAVLRRGKPLP
jgi:hypothetical protein